MKKRINKINNKILVSGGGENLLTKNEILVENNNGNIELKERGSDGKIKSITGDNEDDYYYFYFTNNEKVNAWNNDFLVQAQLGLFEYLLAYEGVLYGDKTAYNIQQDMGGISLLQYTLKNAFESGINKGNFILFIKVPKTYIGCGKIPNSYGHVTKRITIKDPYVALLMGGISENLYLENAIEEVKTALYAPNSYLGQLLLTEGEVTENGFTVKLPLWKNISKTEFDAFVNRLIY